MPIGLEIFEPDGQTLFIGQRTGRVLGMVTTGTADGSYVDASLLEGTPFYQIVSTDSIGSGLDVYGPGVSVSGSTLQWLFDPGTPGARRRPAVIVYGVA